MWRTQFFALTVACGALTSAHADDIRLGVPAYGGTGCPAGSASVTLSPDAQSLSILFDQFVAEAGSLNGKSMDRKSCNIAIPVHVPQGLSVSLIAVDYRGFNSLPSGAYSQFDVEYFFGGSRGPKKSTRFYGDQEEEYLVQDNLIATAMVWSRCGADVILRTNSAMLVRTNSWGEQAMATVDSQDVTAGILYKLSWKKCY